jgi:(p)ppGpp synthase/HD superfamily hydrolase
VKLCQIRAIVNGDVIEFAYQGARLYATHVHGGQVRKATCVPYIAHLLAVAATVLEYNGSEDMAIAALLHDPVEDRSAVALPIKADSGQVAG